MMATANSDGESDRKQCGNGEGRATETVGDALASGSDSENLKWRASPVTTMIPKLPDDAIIEILARLPVRSLLKFRCVCKSWLSLFSSPHFVKAHLTNSNKDTDLTRHGIILDFRGDLKQCSVSSLLNEPITDVSDTDYCGIFKPNSVSMHGSCDGLICFNVDEKDLLLWNPSTRICRKLPDFGVGIDNHGCFAFALGFDKSGDDYKVVGFAISDMGVLVKVYSLNSDRRKRIKEFERLSLMDYSATFTNGKLHWIANPEMQSLRWDIVSLDLETEEFEVLRMPMYIKYGDY